MLVAGLFSAAAIHCSHASGAELACSTHGTRVQATTSGPACRCDPAWTGATCETPVRIAVGPAIAAPAEHPFHAVAAGRAGRALAAAGNAVYALAEGPPVRVLFAAPPDAQVELDPSGSRFGVHTRGRFDVYNRTGALELSLPSNPGEYFRLWPERNRVLVAVPASSSPEHPRIRALRIVDGAGQRAGEIPVEGVDVSRVVRDSIFYAQSEQLVKLSAEGTEMWRAPARLSRFEVSEDGSLVLGIRSAPNTHALVHYSGQGVELGTEPTPDALWNLAVSPRGEYSAGTSKTRVWLFHRGALVRRLELPVRYLVSAAVSDHGHILLGAQDDEHVGRAYLYDQWGNPLWDGIFGEETQAYRPDVHFLPDGSGYLVRGKERIELFSIVQGRLP